MLQGRSGNGWSELEVEQSWDTRESASLEAKLLRE